MQARRELFHENKPGVILCAQTHYKNGGTQNEKSFIDRVMPDDAGAGGVQSKR
jgi:hypothetical protein